MLFVSVICRFTLFEKKNGLTAKSYVILDLTLSVII